MSIYDEYRETPRRKRWKGRPTWTGPNGSVIKEKDGTFYWEKNELAFISDITSRATTRAAGLWGRTADWESAVINAEGLGTVALSESEVPTDQLQPADEKVTLTL